VRGRTGLIIAILLLSSLPASGLADTIPPDTERQTPVTGSDTYSLVGSDPQETVDLLVTLEVGHADDADLVLQVTSMGFTLERTFHSFDCWHLRGPRGLVPTLSSLDGVMFVEEDHPLSYLIEEAKFTFDSYQVGFAMQEMETDVLRNLGIDGSTMETPFGNGPITVAVIDTGLDAGHPDLDYGTKIIKNFKSEGNYIWREMENTDNGGHGTMTSGAVAGNGDASAGARSGVAPGAQIIGLSIGDGPLLINGIGGLEWVYEHSRPGDNPDNIRVVSNSWAGWLQPYNPNSGYTRAVRKITHENNVVVVFGAGNSNGDGSGVNTSEQSNIPYSISVGAMGKYREFIPWWSSRGKADMKETWPDIMMPGDNVWSPKAREVLRIQLKNGDLPDGYYGPGGGTSIATPQASGAVALLWQACPSMRVSQVEEDYTNHSRLAEGPELRLVHEAELILEATADYLPPDSTEGLPEEVYNASGSWIPAPQDFHQGYGSINVTRAVALGLVLHDLRRENDNATVYDAINASGLWSWNGWEMKGDRNTSFGPYVLSIPVDDARNLDRVGPRPKGLGVWREFALMTDRVEASFQGDWARYNDPEGVLVSASHRDIMLPPGTREVDITLTYKGTPPDTNGIVELALTVDTDGNGKPDHTTDYNRVFLDEDEASLHMDVDIDVWTTWTVEVKGQGMDLPETDVGWKDREYGELRAHYEVSVMLTLGSGTGDITPTRVSTRPLEWIPAEPTLGYVLPARMDPGDDGISTATSDWTGYTYTRYLFPHVEPFTPGSDVEGNSILATVVGGGLLLMVLLGMAIHQRARLLPLVKRISPVRG